MEISANLSLEYVTNVYGRPSSHIKDTRNMFNEDDVSGASTSLWTNVFERHRQWKRRRKVERKFSFLKFASLSSNKTSVAMFVVFLFLSSCCLSVARTAGSHATTSVKFPLKITESSPRVLDSSTSTPRTLLQSKSTFSPESPSHDDAKDVTSVSSSFSAWNRHAWTNTASSSPAYMPSKRRAVHDISAVISHPLSLRDSSGSLQATQDMLFSIIPSTSHTLTLTALKTEKKTMIEDGLKKDRPTKKEEENKSKSTAKEWITSKSGFLSLLESLTPYSSSDKKWSHQEVTKKNKGFLAKQQQEKKVDFQVEQEDRVQGITTKTGKEDGRLTTTTKSHPRQFNTWNTSTSKNSSKETQRRERMKKKTKIDLLVLLSKGKEKRTEAEIMNNENLLLKPRRQQQTQKVRRTDFQNQRMLSRQRIRRRTSRQTVNSKSYASLTTGIPREEIYDNRDEEQSLFKMKASQRRQEDVRRNSVKEEDVRQEVSNVRQVSSSEGKMSSTESGMKDREGDEGSTITVSLVSSASSSSPASSWFHDGNNNNLLSSKGDCEERRVLMLRMRDNNDGQDASSSSLPAVESKENDHPIGNHGHEYDDHHRQNETIYTSSSLALTSSSSVDIKEKSSRKEMMARHDVSTEDATAKTTFLSSLFFKVTSNPHSRQRRDGEYSLSWEVEQDSPFHSLFIQVNIVTHLKVS